jgi:hypothetical protein
MNGWWVVGSSSFYDSVRPIRYIAATSHRVRNGRKQARFHRVAEHQQRTMLVGWCSSVREDAPGTWGQPTLDLLAASGGHEEGGLDWSGLQHYCVAAETTMDEQSAHGHRRRCIWIRKQRMVSSTSNREMMTC